MTEPIDLDALAELARKATPGPWRVEMHALDKAPSVVVGSEPWYSDWDEGTNDDGTEYFGVAEMCGVNGTAPAADNAAYIAAVSPDVVLRLIAVAKACVSKVRPEAVEGSNGRWSWECELCGGAWGDGDPTKHHEGCALRALEDSKPTGDEPDCPGSPSGGRQHKFTPDITGRSCLVCGTPTRG